MVGDEQQQARHDAPGRDGDVRLVVPAAPEYLRLVRLTAAGLASRLGFTFDEVEDLRIAVDELCFHLLGGADNGIVDRTMANADVSQRLCLLQDSTSLRGSKRIRLSRLAGQG